MPAESRDGVKVVQRSPSLEVWRDETHGLTVLFEGYLFGEPEWESARGGGESSCNARRVAAAYQAHGVRFFDHIEGAYLAAIVDAENRLIVAGRDGMGRHPLYYASRPGELWIASNIFALVDHAPVSRDPNRLSLALRLLGRWPLAGETFFSDIRRVRPGHFLASDSGGELREQEHWHPVPEDDEPWLSDIEARERFEPMLRNAVNRCLGLGAQGVMLSGGIDSVSIAALASGELRKAGRPPLIAYSARNPPGYAREPEEDVQDKVVRSLGLVHRASTMKDWLGKRDLLSATLERVPALPGPTDIWWTGAYMGFYATPLADGIDTVMTGSGGDEWLGVHRSHAADLLRQLDFRGLYRFARAAAASEGYGWASGTGQVLWKNGLAVLLGSFWMNLAPAQKAAYHRRRREKLIPAWLCPDAGLAAELERAIDVRIPELRGDGRAPRSYYRHSFRGLWSNPLLAYEFERQFHVTRLIGTRILCPFHDREFVRFSNMIHPRVLLGKGRYKSLLRPLAERLVPGVGLEQQRKTDYSLENDPTVEDLEKNIRPAWGRIGCHRLDELGVVDRGRLAKHLEEECGPALVSQFIVLSCESWLKAHA